MKLFRTLLLGFFFSISIFINAQNLSVQSPDEKIIITLNAGNKLLYDVRFNGEVVINPSSLGFELKDEPVMEGNMIIQEHTTKNVNETWIPVIKSKHAEVINHYNELHVVLIEKMAPMRELELFFRAYNDGIAFCYKLKRSATIGERQIHNELTTFNIPGDPKAWIVEYGGYSTSNEAEYFERSLSYLENNSIAGMPLLMEYNDHCWVAITEAKINNYPAFYIGTNGNTNQLATKLVPLPGEPESGIKARFSDEISSPWRVMMIGETQGALIESDLIQNLNDPCAIIDPSWIKPGMSAWDHWWSGGVNMEMPVIKEYIDFASDMGWRYMLVDWQWYGEFNKPEADITQWAPQINLPEIISYAENKNVKILLWLYSSDVNRNSAFKKAFPLYRQWGIAGVKIDFMDRDDQQMVNWYYEIIKCAADNQLLVDFHGAYKPDGIIRTWPNMITREGLMGNEYYKFSDRMNPEHNVKLAFTRMLAGEMDYTPGGFLNVTEPEFRQQTPTLVWNTRSAELAKFVIYESPLTVVCDHPRYILGQQGEDFLKIVPTVWDDIKFLGGYPGNFIALAKRNGNFWYLGVLNNRERKNITIDLDFLPRGSFSCEIWRDTDQSDLDPKELEKKIITVKSGETLKVNLAKNGGFVGRIEL